MAGIPSSPAVVFIERDNSAYPPNIDSSIVGLVGYASKGPVNEPTLITSQENLIQTFGKPRETIVGQGLEGALEILESTNQIRFVRVSPTDALEASANIQFGVCPAVKLAASGFGVTNAMYLNVTLTDADGTQVLENKLYSIPVASDNLLLGQASSVAKVIGNGDSPTDPMFVAFDTATTSTGYLAATYAGKYAVLSLSSYSDVTLTTPISGLQPLTLSSGGDAGAVVSSLTITGIDIDTSSFAYRVLSMYDGDGYNLSSDISTGQTLGVSIEVNPGGGLYSLLTVNNDGVAAETYKVSMLDDSTFIENVINIGTDNAVSDYIKGELYYQGASLAGTTPHADDVTTLSSLGTMTQGVNLTYAGGSRALSASPLIVRLIDKTTGLADGSIGTMDTSTTLIGTAADKTGIYTLDDDLLNISLAGVPGITDQRVQNALITLAETSQNFLAIVSPPLGLDTVEEATDWMNGKGDGRTAAINSSWGAVYWPWVQVFDVFSAKDRWYDPAIFAIRQMVFTDNVAEAWFAPAGFRRGRLTKPTAVEKSLNQGDRDSLYVTNINPIVNFAPEGITIFGQKTAQRAPTSLDRVNVRRLMIFLRKVLLQSGREDLFQPNDVFTWEIIKDKSEAILSDVQARRGITDFRVICDDTVNTPVRVDRNELWCKILLKPTKTAEWIIFEVNLTNQSAKFSG
jgi:phage tail sheath protein FI